jgi:hypothetical protein
LALKTLEIFGAENPALRGFLRLIKIEAGSTLLPSGCAASHVKLNPTKAKTAIIKPHYP